MCSLLDYTKSNTQFICLRRVYQQIFISFYQLFQNNNLILVFIFCYPTNSFREFQIGTHTIRSSELRNAFGKLENLRNIVFQGSQIFVLQFHSLCSRKPFFEM